MNVPVRPAVVASDEELIEQIASGSVDALGLLYDRFCTRARRLAQSVCRDNGRADEAVQDAFMSVWRSSGTYHEQRGGVSAWLLTIVRRKAIDVVRREGPRDARQVDDGGLEDLPGEAVDVPARVSANGDASDLRAKLERLPDPQREVIALAYYGELSHGEIAEHLGVPAGTVKGRMRLGMAKLRDQVAAPGVG